MPQQKWTGGLQSLYYYIVVVFKIEIPSKETSSSTVVQRLPHLHNLATHCSNQVPVFILWG